MTTITLVTAKGTNASEIADAHTAGDFCGLVVWYGSVDNCDADGCGRVSIRCKNNADVKQICEAIENDDRVDSYYKTER